MIRFSIIASTRTAKIMLTIWTTTPNTWTQPNPLVQIVLVLFLFSFKSIQPTASKTCLNKWWWPNISLITQTILNQITWIKILKTKKFSWEDPKPFGNKSKRITSTGYRQNNYWLLKIKVRNTISISILTKNYWKTNAKQISEAPELYLRQIRCIRRDSVRKKVRINNKKTSVFTQSSQAYPNMTQGTIFLTRMKRWITWNNNKLCCKQAIFLTQWRTLVCNPPPTLILTRLWNQHRITPWYPLFRQRLVPLLRLWQGEWFHSKRIQNQ